MNGAWHYMEGERLLYQLSALADEDPAVWPIALRAQAHMAAAHAAVLAEDAWAHNRVKAGAQWRDALDHNPMVCGVPLPDAAGICGNDVEPGATDCGGHRTAVEPPNATEQALADARRTGWVDEATGLVSGGLVTDELPMSMPPVDDRPTGRYIVGGDGIPYGPFPPERGDGIATTATTDIREYTSHPETQHYEVGPHPFGPPQDVWHPECACGKPWPCSEASR